MNSKSYKEHFSVPVMCNINDHLYSSKVFTTLYLKNTFLQKQVDDNTRILMCFVTHFGQFKFWFMNFDLFNWALLFQNYDYIAFCDEINEKMLIIYLDDIVIPAETEVKELQKFQPFLTSACDYGLVEQ